MLNALPRISLALLGILALVAFAPKAYASNVDFACGSTAGLIACTGSVTVAGGFYSSGAGGITVYNNGGPYPANTAFTLTFNTSTGVMSLTNGTDTLSGTITSFSAFSGSTTTALTMVVTWTSIPGSVQAQLGTPTGLDTAVVQFVFNPPGNLVNSADILITPTPEPGTMALFGSGLVALSAILRRKLRR